MKYEEHGCIDINKLQEIENQKIEEKMQKKFKKGFTPSHNVQKLISAKDLKITSRKVDWIIDKIIERKNLILLAGESSSGKTSLMYAMASAIGEGSKFLNTFSTIKGKVLFIQAKIMLSNNYNKKATQILKKIVKSKDETYSPLSLFLIIDKNLEIEEKKVDELFDFILTINSLDDEDKNLIKLKKAIYISDKSDEKNVLELLNPIINSDSVWKEQSIKFLGDYYFSLNEFQKAKQYYLTIVNEFEDNTFSKEAKRKLQLIKND